MSDTAGAVLSIDSLEGPEPPIWPVPYAASFTLADESAQTSSRAPGPVVFRVNPTDAEQLFAGSGHTFAELKKLKESGGKVPSFALPGELRATIAVDEKRFTSDNLVGSLRGSDPAVADEYVVLTAHLDGYGVGEPRNGDAIYNGAFDDAAYVALLMDLAKSLHESGTKLRRSLLLCVVTGEEKGLLGSRYFAAHPTLPKGRMAADLNLDQLRPIFPLNTLTVLAVNESNLGRTVQDVALRFGIRVRCRHVFLFEMSYAVLPL